MMDKEFVSPTSPCIGVEQTRNLYELVKAIGTVLTQEEYEKIVCVFGLAANRILKENGLDG